MYQKILLILISVWLFSLNTFGQSCDGIDQYCFDSASITACQGTLYFEENPTNPEHDDTLTLYPGVNGGHMRLLFSQFNLECNGSVCDEIIIYDGSNTNAPIIGIFSGTELVLSEVTSTSPGGSLTIVVVDDTDAFFFGISVFTASLSCTDPCLVGSAVPTLTGYNNLDGGFAQFCFGQEIFLDASSSAPPEGFEVAEYRWTISQHEQIATLEEQYIPVIEDAGIYSVDLEILWTTGCTSTETLEDLIAYNNDIVIEPETPLNLCTNQEITFNGQSSTGSISNIPPNSSDNLQYLADGAGFSFDDIITVSGYAENASIADCADLGAIIINMEHSYMGDINISLTCPNGTTVNLVCWETNGGGGTYLGEPIDDGFNSPGIGYDYSWSADAVNGTWGENAAFNNTLPSGNYESCEDICSFVGCPFNGDWTMTVTDNLGGDNGYVFGWRFETDNSDFINALYYTPTIGANADSSFWTSPENFPLSENADEITLYSETANTTSLQYEVISSAGCHATSDFELNFIDNPLVVDAGDDFYYGMTGFLLNGSVSLDDAPCVGSETIEYCLGEFETSEITLCSSELFGCDGPIALTILETDNAITPTSIYIYDGIDDMSPLLAIPIPAEQGMTFYSTNEEGCLFMYVAMPFDGLDCESGDIPPLRIQIATHFEDQIDYHWEQSNDIDNPSALITFVDPAELVTEYVLNAELANSFGCALSDTVQVTLPQFIIEGFVFYDLNENGIFDAEETIIPNFPITYNNGESMTFSNVDGSYSAFVNPGENTISIYVNPVLWTPTTPTEYITVLNFENQIIEQQNFGVVANIPNTSGIIHPINYGSICNTSSTHVLTLFNNGNVPLNGILEFEFPASANFLASTPEPVSQTGNTLHYGVSNLGVNQQAAITIIISLPGVEDIGNWMMFESSLASADNPGVVLDEDISGFQLACAYDPNIKVESTGYGIEGWKIANDDLIYTIHFQNTGTAPAQNVLLTDLLPPELQWNSLQPIASSHPFHLTMSSLGTSNQGYAEFEFENIQLPDSVSDEAGSHGYVTFIIQQIPDLSPGTIFHNQASIYFDLNPPIITNQTINTIIDCNQVEAILSNSNGTLMAEPSIGPVNWFYNESMLDHDHSSTFTPNSPGSYFFELPISAECIVQSSPEIITRVDNNHIHDIYINPNPTSNNINWQTQQRMIQISCFNATGMLVKEISNLNQSKQGVVMLSELPDGVYFLQFINDSQEFFSKRIVLMH